MDHPKPKTPKHPTKSAHKIIPQFLSRNIPATIVFYRTKLHFVASEPYPSAENARFTSVFIGRHADANIYFHLVDDPNEFHAREAMIAMGTKQCETYYEELCKLGERSGGMGVEIVEPIEDKEWGYRQFSIKDEDGNRLTFFRFLEGSNGPYEDEDYEDEDEEGKGGEKEEGGAK